MIYRICVNLIGTNGYIFYNDSSISKFPFQKAMFGWRLGPDKNEGNKMTQWVLKQNGKIVPWRMLQKPTMEQLAPSNEIKQQKRAVFDADIRRVIGDSFSLPIYGMHLETRDVIEEESDEFYDPTPFLADDDEVLCSVPVADCVDVNGQPILDGSLTDVMISAEVLLPQGEVPQLAKLLCQSIDKN